MRTQQPVVPQSVTARLLVRTALAVAMSTAIVSVRALADGGQAPAPMGPAAAAPAPAAASSNGPASDFPSQEVMAVPAARANATAARWIHYQSQWNLENVVD